MNNNDRVSDLNSRRSFLVGSIAAVAAVSSTGVLSASKDHSHHHSNKYTELVISALHCIQTAQYCRAHCIELIKSGDTSLADCLEAVTDTISVCETLVQLSASDNRHLKAYASVCIDICKDCEMECEKHQEKHKECKECMLSCIDCIEQLEKLVA